jgi:hypothetical protein
MLTGLIGVWMGCYFGDRAGMLFEVSHSTFQSKMTWGRTRGLTFARIGQQGWADSGIWSAASGDSVNRTSATRIPAQS